MFPPGIWHDDGVYVLLGRSLAQGEGLRYVGLPGEPLAPKFPPLFPLFLAGIWLLAPSFPENLYLLTGVNLVLLAAAGGLFSAYIRRVFSLSLPLALGVTLLAWLSPHLWRFALIPLSEPLFLVIMVGALWAGALAEEREGWGRVLWFVFLAGLTAMTRTVGVAVLLAGALALLSRGRRGATVGILLGSLAILLPWVLWSRTASGTIPAGLQDTLGSYGGWWVKQVLASPGESVVFMAGNSVHLTGRLLALLLPGVSGPLLWVGLLLLPPLLVGMVEAGRKSRTMPLAVLFSAGILAAWPFQDIRLAVPLYPFLVLATILGFRALAALRPELGWVRRGVLAVGGIWVAALAGMSVQRLATGWPGEPFRTRSQALVSAVQAVAQHTPPEAVVGAPEAWAGLHLFTGRTVTPSAPFLPLARDKPTWGTPVEQYRLWRETGMTHILVEHGGRVHGEALDRMDRLCPDGGVILLVNRPGQFLVELGWDDACRARLLESRSP